MWIISMASKMAEADWGPLMSFTRLMLMQCSSFYIIKHEQFFSEIYRPYEQSDMQTGTEWPIVTIYV